jgi:uncharacterized protein YjlB
MKANIADVPLPETDPFQGNNGALHEYWSA